MVVVDLLEAKRVGSERRYGELIRRIWEDGHEIHLFARRWDPKAAHGLVCHRVPVVGPSSLTPLVFALGALAVTRRWRHRLDVIHSHAKSLGEDIVSPGGSAHRAYVEVLGREGRWLRRLALPWHPFHRLQIAVERIQFARARRIVLNSEWAQRMLLHAYPRAAPRTNVVYNGVDSEYFSPAVCAGLRGPARARLGLAGEEMAFLFVGAGIRRKGLLELLGAFARLRSGRVRLVVLGWQDKKEAERMRGAVACLGLGDRVRVEGFAADPRPYYAAADAFVLPTKFDPFSNATAEALACGLPVITTAANGVSELMTDGLEGMVLADPYNLRGLAEALARLQDADRKRMGEAGRALAERLTWKRHVDGMLAVYDAVRRGRS